MDHVKEVSLPLLPQRQRAGAPHIGRDWARTHQACHPDSKGRCIVFSTIFALQNARAPPILPHLSCHSFIGTTSTNPATMALRIQTATAQRAAAKAPVAKANKFMVWQPVNNK